MYECMLLVVRFGVREREERRKYFIFLVDVVWEGRNEEEAAAAAAAAAATERRRRRDLAKRREQNIRRRKEEEEESESESPFPRDSFHFCCDTHAPRERERGHGCNF